MSSFPSLVMGFLFFSCRIFIWLHEFTVRPAAVMMTFRSRAAQDSSGFLMIRIIGPLCNSKQMFEIVVSHTGATSQLLTRSIFSRACILSHLFNGVYSLRRWPCHVACHPSFKPYGLLTTHDCKWSYGSINWTTLPPAGHCSTGKHSKLSLGPSVELQQHEARSSRRKLFVLIVEVFIFFFFIIRDQSPFYQRYVPILGQR